MGFMQKYWAARSYNICLKTKTKNDILIGFVNNKHEHFTVIDTHFNLVFHDKHKTAQNLHACKCRTHFCDLVKNHQ